jgi:hypothetical protein
MKMTNSCQKNELILSQSKIYKSHILTYYSGFFMKCFWTFISVKTKTWIENQKKLKITVMANKIINQNSI